MKRILFFFLIALNASAQEPARIRTSLALHLGAATNNDHAGARFSYGGGAEFSRALTPRMAIVIKPTLMRRSYGGPLPANATYFDLPLGLDWNWKTIALGGPIHYFFGLGAYGGIGIAGTTGLDGGKRSLRFGSGNSDDRSRFDFGLQGSFGLSGNRGGKVGFNIQVGTRNVLPAARRGLESPLRLDNFGFYVTVPVTRS